MLTDVALIFFESAYYSAAASLLKTEHPLDSRQSWGLSILGSRNSFVS